ncbi:MAG: aminotransferase class V-fold PLP-dependent enzyme [Thermoproteota archaeon]
MGVINVYDETIRIREVINVSGTMTALGSCSAAPEVVEAMAYILPKFVDMLALQREASRVIQKVIGSEAGCITSCAAAGIAISVAACMTGADMAKVEQLPDVKGLKNEVIIQRGHMVWFGASVGQMVRLTGATIIEIGDVNRAGVYQLEGAIRESTAAALYVVSHHTVQYGQIALEDFCEVCHKYGVPVIVDAASESNMRYFIDCGADLVCFSGHKFLAGPTSGIIAGRKDLVQACLYHQFHGIGRAMKIGKEGIVGVLAALLRWDKIDHQVEKERQQRIVEKFIKNLHGLKGAVISIEPDPTGNPIDRVKVYVDPRLAGITASIIAYELAKHDPPIIVRAHHVDEGYFLLDPTTVVEEEAVDVVCEAIRQLFELAPEKKRALCARYQESPNAADALVQQLAHWLDEPA